MFQQAFKTLFSPAFKQNLSRSQLPKSHLEQGLTQIRFDSKTLIWTQCASLCSSSAVITWLHLTQYSCAHCNSDLLRFPQNPPDESAKAELCIVTIFLHAMSPCYCARAGFTDGDPSSPQLRRSQCINALRIIRHSSAQALWRLNIDYLASKFTHADVKTSALWRKAIV